MDNKKIEKLLKSTKPDSEINNQHKQDLRRKLLNSNQFNKNPFFGFKGKLIITASFAVLVLMILFNPVSVNDNISAEELVNKIQANYAGFYIPDKLNVFDSDLRIFGKENEIVDLDVQRTIDYGNNRYRLTLFKKASDEVLDDYIIINGKAYRTPSPKIEVKNASMNFSTKELSNSFSYQFKKDSIDSLDFYVHKFETPEHLDHAFIVYKSSSIMGNEIDQGFEHKVKVNKEIDLDEYLRANPVDISSKLKNKDNRVLGIKDDKELNGEFYVMESISEFNPKEMRILLKTFTHSKEVSDNDSNDFRVEHIDPDSIKSRFIKKKKIKKIETLKIEPATGEILQIKYSVSKNGKRIDLSKITFIKSSRNTKDESCFNSVTNGFVYKYEVED